MYLGFWKTIWSIAAPRPSVMIASFTPRVRTAGSAKISPIGTVPTTPITRAASNGTFVVATRRPAIKAPTPANAYCASEICPA